MGIIKWLGALAGVALFAGACGGGDKEFEPSSDPARNIDVAQVKKVNAVIAGSEWAVGTNNFVVGITDEKDEPQSGATVKMTFYDIRDAANPKQLFVVDGVQSAPGVGPTVEHLHTSGDTHTHGGEDDGRVGYFARVNFTYAGNWGVAVTATLKDGKTSDTSNIAFTVVDKATIVTAGQKAPLSNNLTKADVKDIKEIDSGDPPNDMHDVKIKDAIAAGRPVVVVFATPLYCASRFCGPVVEEVEALQEAYKSKVDFVHIEIWADFATKKLNDTVKQWIVRADGGLTEPWVFVVDKNGVVYDRWEGPVARNIMEAAVKDVSEGKIYQAR